VYVDTHVHLQETDPAQALPDLVARAREAGVDRFVAVGGSDSLNTRALEAAARFPRNVVAAVGLDREQARLSVGQLESAMRRTAAFFEPDAGQPRPVAVGETGLDFHYGADTRERQLDLFRQHLALARRVCLPVIVHSREAESETLAALSDHAAAWSGGAGCVGVLHCFTGSAEMAEACLELGMAISFSGIVTFKRAAPLRAVAAEMPADRLLIETDTPYLAPEPFRGRTNEPALLPHVATCLADLRGISLQALAETTSRNARRVFRLDEA